MMGDKKIRVLYDEICFAQTHGGVSRYFTELMKHLPDNVSWKLSALSSNNIYLNRAPFNLPPMTQDVNDFVREWCGGHYFPGVCHVYRNLARIFPRRFPSSELANRRYFNSLVKQGDFDILHITDAHPVFNSWKSVLGKKKIVATIHDLIPDFNDNPRVKYFRKQIIKDADQLIAISQNTKDDLIRFYGAPAEKITVVHHGYIGLSSGSCELNSLTTRPITDRYLLFVGKRGGYKNFEFFVRAVAPLLLSKAELSIFCTGTPFTATESRLLCDLGIKNKVCQAFVPDDEMPTLYANSVAFVFPSRYEGFGIPILDAFACGCPVILSRASCFPEVAGDAALYFELNDPDSLSKKVNELLTNQQTRDRLVESGRQRVHDFTWDRCAQKTVVVYQEVLNGDK